MTNDFVPMGGDPRWMARAQRRGVRGEVIKRLAELIKNIGQKKLQRKQKNQLRLLEKRKKTIKKLKQILLQKLFKH